MLTVHHLGRSQSERIVWLCEELGLDYDLKRYDRVKETRLAPPEYKALHPLGAAPVIDDEGLRLAESGAIIDYLIGRYGHGRLARKPNDVDFAAYLYWFHYANGGLQPTTMRVMFARRLVASTSDPAFAGLVARFELALRHVEARLSSVPWLAGADFTAADIMSVFTLTTARIFEPFDLTPYPAILRGLQRVGARPAYRRARKKAEPDMEPLLGAKPHPVSLP